MSKALVFSEALDNTNIEICGIKATMMTQQEILARASASIQAPLKKAEREFYSSNICLPLAVPVVPVDKQKSSKDKPKTVMHQLNDNHLGTTQFRSVCATCGLGSDKCCGKSGVHVLPLPISPVSHAPILLELCKATCFACSRFLSNEYEDQLESSPIMDYPECADSVHEHGKSEGGRIAMASVEESARRWQKFVDLIPAVNRKLLKMAMTKGLSAIECQQCGALQPSEISMHQKVVATTWNIAQTNRSTAIPFVPHTTDASIWKPNDLFWTNIFHVLNAVKATEDDCSCHENEGNGPCKIDGLQWIGRRLLHVMTKQIKYMSDQEHWLMLVLPFIIGGQVLSHTLERYFTYADIQKRLSKMRHVDIWRVGKSPLYSHPEDFVWTNLYIADKVMRPIVQETSGGMIRANDPRTESYELLIKRSAKLRLVVSQQSKLGLESWMRMCKFDDMERFLQTCFPDSQDIFLLHEYAGDVRMGYVPPSNDVAMLYSNLQHEISSIFDHTVDAMGKKSHDSAATGVKNAKIQARMNQKRAANSSSAVMSAALIDEDAQNESTSVLQVAQPPAQKKRATKKIKNNQPAHGTTCADKPKERYTIVSLDVSKMPCPCKLFDANGILLDRESIEANDQNYASSFNFLDGSFGLVPSLQRSIWMRAVATVLSSWEHLIVDHYSNPMRLFAVQDLIIEHGAFALGNEGFMLYPCTTEQLIGASQNQILTAHAGRDGLQNRSIPEKCKFLPRLPSPEQFKTAKFRGGGGGGGGGAGSGSKGGAAAAKKQSGNLKKHLDGKNNMLRYNVITKRVNFSGRFVLVPCGTLAPDQVGVPYRFCLGQSHPVVVTHANIKQLSLYLAKARYWSYMGFLPDLGGIESVVTDEGIQITINNVILPGEEFFDDQVFVLNLEKKEALLKSFANEQDFVEQWGAPLVVGWTCNVYLKDGDTVIISRPPVLHRYNHCAMTVVAIAGFVIALLTSVMHGFGADADGDAMMITVMQSTHAKAAIRLLMPLVNNMICPRQHAILCALQQDALLGACLLIAESDRFQLDKRDATKLASCFRLIDSSRFSRVGFKGRGEAFIDPKTRYGPLWRLMVPTQNGSSSAINGSCRETIMRIPPPAGKNVHGKSYWTGLQFVESSFPPDFCYYKRLKGCPWSILQVLSFVTQLVECETVQAQRNLPKSFADFPYDTLVVIWRGKWICGAANGGTLSTTSDTIIEALWRHYGKHFACDWMGDLCMLAQTYLSDIRGFSCSISDMIMGGRSNFSDALLDSKKMSDGTTSCIDANQASELDDCDNDGVPRLNSAWPLNDDNLSKLSYLQHVEAQRVRALSAIENTFELANQYMDAESSQLTRGDYNKANAKLAEYANIMILYGGNMFAAHNKTHLNNISLMAKTGAKGNSTNTAMISATLGVAKIKGTRSVGHDIQPGTRNFFGDAYGERSAATLGFINRGFIHGLTGYQFNQTSREARNRIKNCSDPSTTGYLQTKIGVNSQSVSVRMDGTVRNQQHEIIQFNYGGDGYDACKITRVRFERAMFFAALEQESGIAKHQTHSVLSLVLGKMSERPEHDFASAKTLMGRGFSVLLNVDVPNLFLLHSGLWQNTETKKKDQYCSDDDIAFGFEQFCARVLQFDPTRSLMPFDLFLAVRLYLSHTVFGPMRWCTHDNLTCLLNDLYKTYCENMADPGEAVGPLACQSSNQPMTQLIMKSFKTDVGNAKEALHIGSDVSRITELFGFTDPKAAIASIVLSPSWVKTEKQAQYVASQFVGVLLSEWIVEHGHAAHWINLCDSSECRAGLAMSQASNCILQEYESNDCRRMPLYHEVCTWKLKSNFLILPAISQYIALFVDEQDDDAPLNGQILTEALTFVEQSWKACLASTQMGGLLVEPCAESDQNPAGLELTLWMAFRHADKDFATGVFDSPIDEGPNTSRMAAAESWMSQMTNLVSDLTYSIHIAGHAEVEQLMSCEPPQFSAAESTGDEKDLGLPDIATCFRLRFRSKRLAPFLWHPCVVDQLCYSSNLKEIRDVYGIEATSQMLTFEASRVLSSEVDVYVQPRHFQLLGDVMTSEGDVLAMTQHGLKKRRKTSYLAGMSFEDVAANLLKGGPNGRYDALDHIVANIMFAQKDSYIGSGSCRVVATPDNDASSSSSSSCNVSATTAKSNHQSRYARPPDYESLAVGPSECDLYNMIDFVVGSSFV